MTTLSINLDGEALREATVQAMVSTLTPEVREQIIRQALDRILAPSMNSWEKGESPIEMAFKNAIMGVAREEAQRLMREDKGVVERVHSLLHDAIEKMLGADPEKMASRMADAFVASLRER